MEVEMSCFCVGIGVIRGMLYGTKIKNIKFSRYNYHSARMLTGCTFYTGTTDFKMLNFGLVFINVAFVAVFTNIAICRFFGNRCDCARFKYVFATE